MKEDMFFKSDGTKDFMRSLPETDAEVYACFHQLYPAIQAKALWGLYQIQREAYGKSVLEAYKLTLLDYIKA